MPMNFKDDIPPNTSGPPTGNDVDLVSTHQRLLIAAALRTKGLILELGCGWYSTPLLHEIARAQQRRLVTVDNQPYWLPQFEELECQYHSIKFVGSWLDLYKHKKEFLGLSSNYQKCSNCWGGVECKICDGLGSIMSTERVGLCLCDHGQPIEREYAVHYMRDIVDVWVFHDTEEGFAYGYDRTLPTFKYKWTDKSQKTHTTVASSVVDVTKWGLIELPERGLTEDVT